MEENKKRIILMQEGSPAHDRFEIEQTLLELAKKGDAESIKALREMQAEDDFNRMIENIDNDEYEFII